MASIPLASTFPPLPSMSPTWKNRDSARCCGAGCHSSACARMAPRIDLRALPADRADTVRLDARLAFDALRRREHPTQIGAAHAAIASCESVDTGRFEPLIKDHYFVGP